MSESEKSGVDRRRFLIAGAAASGLVLAGCSKTGGTTKAADVKAAGNANQAAGKAVTLGFSAPAADHGWIAAITKNAKAQAALYKDVTLAATEGTNDVNQQISQVQTLIDRKVDALVILPYDGKALTEIAKQAMAAGIPVVNLDRIFDTPLAYRTWIGGDNYGMGVNAGNFMAQRLKDKGVKDPVIAEIAGIDNLQLTQDRSRGFSEALKAHGLSIAIRQAADFTPDTGQKVMSNVLQAKKHLDAVWNHDDDQGIGVEAAIKQAGRDEFFMVGGAGSLHAMNEIKADNTVLKATVLYSPSMASSAISVGRLIAQNRGMSDLVEREVPSYIQTFSAVVTKENAADYLAVGFV